MVSAPGWVIFSGWTGVGVNFGLGTKTFCPDTVTAHTAPARDPVPAGWPAVPVMPGIPTISAKPAATAASGYEPKSVAVRRGVITSPPPSRTLLRGSGAGDIVTHG